MSTSIDLDLDSQLQAATVQVPKFNSVRQDANPILAKHLLQELDRMVAQWQEQLQQIDRRSLEITSSGTVLAAWLESRKFKPSNTTGQPIATPYAAVDAHNLTEIDPQVNYRLCGLDEHGQLWQRPCPMTEILSVSQAIARYQQLKDLTERKQKIERHIRQILEDLVNLRLKLVD